jgi:hypothetical protein
MTTEEYKSELRILLKQHDNGFITARELSQQIAVRTLAFQKGPDYVIGGIQG